MHDAKKYALGRQPGHVEFGLPERAPGFLNQPGGRRLAVAHRVSAAQGKAAMRVKLPDFPPIRSGLEYVTEVERRLARGLRFARRGRTGRGGRGGGGGGFHFHLRLCRISGFERETDRKSVV